MNKKILTQIELYIKGLLSRLEEEQSRSVFSEIQIRFRSGAKEYPAELSVSESMDSEYIWSYNGRKDVIVLSDLPLTILTAAELYDSMEFRYIEQERVTVVSADQKQVKMQTENRKNQLEAMKRSVEQSHIGTREYIIKAGEADALLKAIGIMAPNGKIRNDRIRKYNQIDHFVELISEPLQELAKGRKEILVLDCACGKSYLSFVLNYYIRFILRKPCRFIGIDYSETVIKASEQMARELNYSNMKFIQADLTVYQPSEPIDLCISLHACDTATDMALACGIHSRAAMMVAVPCCHKELLEQYQLPGLEPLLKHGILKARISDALTDALRASFLEAMGYDVSVVEYISPLETPKNLMIKAFKKRSVNEEKLSAYWQLCTELNVSPSLAKYGI